MKLGKVELNKELVKVRCRRSVFSAEKSMICGFLIRTFTFVKIVFQQKRGSLDLKEVSETIVNGKVYTEYVAAIDETIKRKKLSKDCKHLDENLFNSIFNYMKNEKGIYELFCSCGLMQNLEIRFCPFCGVELK